MPSVRAAGLMKRRSTFESRIGFPSFTDWKTRSSGPLDLTTRNFRTARTALTEISKVFSRSIRSISSGSTAIGAAEASVFGAFPIAAAVPFTDHDRVRMDVPPPQPDHFRRAQTGPEAHTNHRGVGLRYEFEEVIKLLWREDRLRSARSFVFWEFESIERIFLEKLSVDSRAQDAAQCIADLEQRGVLDSARPICKISMHVRAREVG
jgi:hypothetical protein